jgi:methyltransferase (TIGR00027 family)
MKAGRSSRTSEWVAALRALYTGAPGGLDVAPDPVARDLLPPLLGQEVRLMQISPLGARLAHRAIGALTRGLSYGVPLRTAAIDEAVRAGLAAGIDPLVVLGAGLDARAFRMPELAAAAVYELDHPETQADKRDRVRALSPLAGSLAFCAIDFEKQRIGEVLPRAGFDPARPSFWIWEGVSMYLTPAAIRATLDEIAAAAADQSGLAMTYSPPTSASQIARRTAQAIAGLIGEPLHGRMETRAAHALLDERGFRVELDESAIDWAARYWPPSEHRRARAYERLIVARRQLSRR